MNKPVGDGIANIGIMADRDDRRSTCLRVPDHVDHNRPVFRVQRCGRFVQQQDRVVGDEAAREVDALLLAAREGRRRDRVQPREECSVSTAVSGPHARAAH